MKIIEILDLINSIKESIITDFKAETGDAPETSEELIEHIKKSYINNMEHTILDGLYLDDLEYPDDIYKLLLVASIHNYSSENN
jgi:hypothetical protein